MKMEAGSSLQIRRITQEIKDLQNTPSPDFYSAPLEV